MVELRDAAAWRRPRTGETCVKARSIIDRRDGVAGQARTLDAARTPRPSAAARPKGRGGHAVYQGARASSSARSERRRGARSGERKRPTSGRSSARPRRRPKRSGARSARAARRARRRHRERREAARGGATAREEKEEEARDEEAAESVRGGNDAAPGRVRGRGNAEERPRRQRRGAVDLSGRYDDGHSDVDLDMLARSARVRAQYSNGKAPIGAVPERWRVLVGDD